MATQKVDDEGNFWFLSQADSDRNKAIEKNSKVQLIYAKTSDTHFMSVYGSAIISKDRKKIDEMWTNIATAWFKGGKDDPNLSLICVKPESAYYWDTKHGKIVSLFKIAASAITSKSSDDGIEGKLKV
jgi:general stress protein 26